MSKARFVVRAGALLLAVALFPPVPEGEAADDLLDSSRARPYWATFCEGKNADVPLPDDPRTLVQPGIESGNVYFNAHWEDCHANFDELYPDDRGAPTTCGEYREQVLRGREVLFGGAISSGSRTATSFDSQWKNWGLDVKPAQREFEAMLTLRYGLNPAPFRNPYPLPGEDPNDPALDGGSGQLPLAYRQGKNPNGKWTGTLQTTACLYCHGGMVGAPGTENLGTAALTGLGNGNANLDVIMAGHDANAQYGIPSILPAFSQGFDSAFAIGIDQRGQNNAVFLFEVLAAILDKDSLDLHPHADPNLTHNSSGVQDSPTWWNVSHRPRKFFDAGVSMDSHRIVMAAGGFGFGAAYRNQIETYDGDLATFLESLESPPYPARATVDEDLARQGAIHFHELDLWESTRRNPVTKPSGGNGSCASCHGAYAARYVNDTAYLPDPSLEGVAGHILPHAVIGTDPSRADNLTPYLRDQFGRTFWGYPDGVPGWVAPEDKDPITEFVDDESPTRPNGLCTWEQGVIGYQAPPLFGVWASAPYFHNGAIPTVAQVLDTSKRPTIWRRQLQTLGPVTGYDQRFAEAYDQTRLGWKHDVLTCADKAGYDAIENCDPVDPERPTVLQAVLNLVKTNLNVGAAITQPQLSEDGIENRFIFDTRKVGNSKGGHSFTDVLTDAERTAILEYLKTL